jgi:hypothetical protein
LLAILAASCAGPEPLRPGQGGRPLIGSAPQPPAEVPIVEDEPDRGPATVPEAPPLAPEVAALFEDAPLPDGTPVTWVHRPHPAIVRNETELVRVYTDMLAEPARADKERAATLVARARSQAGLWHVREALADIDAAIALSPDSAVLHLERAKLFGLLGRPGDAAAPLNRAFRSEPDSSRTAAVLGGLRFQEGLYAEAAEALGFHAEGNDATASMRMLHAVALLRTGRQPDFSKLGTVRDRWPGAVGSLLARRVGREALLALARAEQGAPPHEVACLAWFCLGQRALVEGDTGRAARDFVAVLRSGCTTADEYRLATAELVRLGILASDSLPGAVE